MRKIWINEKYYVFDDFKINKSENEILTIGNFTYENRPMKMYKIYERYCEESDSSDRYEITDLNPSDEENIPPDAYSFHYYEIQIIKEGEDIIYKFPPIEFKKDIPSG